ncbi:DUF899 family protein [Mycolicibacterium sp. HK-90]|nr:DUF899 family protein [Mycolicibacterium sp. HK-90]WKG06769.1 DUF899 family protein [Mycolicibacterium sp. HK-90]
MGTHSVLHPGRRRLLPRLRRRRVLRAQRVRQRRGRVYRSYFVNGRGIEEIGPVWSFLDITPLGRQESWQDVPPGRPQGPAYDWWRLHDHYGGIAR